MGMIFTLALGLMVAAQDDPFDQSKVPLEVESPDPAAAKIVLVAGRMSHGPGDHEYFAGLALLMNMLKQTPGVFPVMARDGWPRSPKIFEGARSIVIFADGGGGHPILKDDRMEVLQKPLDGGAGFVCLHYAVNFPVKVGDRIRKWLGGYFEAGHSASGASQWDADFKELPSHAVARGVPPFKLRDEWYYHMRFAEGVTPILKAVPPDKTRNSDDAKKHAGEEEVTAWTFQRENGGRSFGYTGGHLHKNWGDMNVRRLVTNAILWTAKVEVPVEGARVDLDPADLNRNLDDKRKPKK